MDPPVLYPRQVTFLPLIVPDLGLVAACGAVLTPIVCRFAAGESHARLHRWWTGPMEELLGLWRRLHALSKERVAALEAAAAGGSNAVVALSGVNSGAPVLDCLVVVIGCLVRRALSCPRLTSSFGGRISRSSR